MSDSGKCCALGQGLASDEIERLRDLFRQQNIPLDEQEWIARIHSPGTKDNCPFRFSLGPDTDYCTSKCHLMEVSKQDAYSRSR